MESTHKIYQLTPSRMKIQLCGLQEASVEVYVRLRNDMQGIPLQKSESDSTIVKASEYFSFIEGCKNRGVVPCVVVEMNFINNRACLEEFKDSDYLSEVEYSVEHGKLLIIIC